MKAVKKLVSMLSLGALISTAAFAASVEDSYLATAKREAGVPVPVSVTAPDSYGVGAGSKAYLTFVVDEQGVPQNIAVKSTNSEALAANAVKAVASWRFEPVTVDGKAVATKVTLPIVAKNPEFGGSRFAMN